MGVPHPSVAFGGDGHAVIGDSTNDEQRQNGTRKCELKFSVQRTLISQFHFRLGIDALCQTKGSL
jgi:hypothetical protein